METPKIIHQIWSGIEEPLPQYFKNMGETWKYDYPTWEYKIWDNQMMNEFIHSFYPEFWDMYNGFPYNIQRWDTIRYLILYKMGGLYVDFDYESLHPMDGLLQGKTCCFSMEPYLHRTVAMNFNNALMLSTPGHFFMKKIIEEIFYSKKDISIDKKTKEEFVFSTTGPWLINHLYENLSEKEKKEVYLIPSEYVSPFNMWQAKAIREGIQEREFKKIVSKAYAIHFHIGGWIKSSQ